MVDCNNKERRGEKESWKHGIDERIRRILFFCIPLDSLYKEQKKKIKK